MRYFKVAQIIISSEAINGFTKLVMRRRVERVQHVWSVHDDGHYVIYDGDTDGWVAGHNMTRLPECAASNTARVVRNVSVASRAVMRGFSLPKITAQKCSIWRA